MKKILFLCICFFTFVVVFEAIAQKPTFVRKQRQPDFFVPTNELERKEVLPTQFRPAQPVREEVVANTDERTIRKANISKAKEQGIDVGQYSYYATGERVSEYKKAYDEYVKDLDYIKKYNKIPINIEKDKDLGKMNSDMIKRVW